MPATAAKAGFGLKFQRGDGSTPTEVFVDVAEVTSGEGGELIQNFTDATHMQSDNRYMEQVPTTLQVGDFTLNVNLLLGTPSQDILRADQASARRGNYRIIYPNTGRRLQGAGFVKNFVAQAPMDGKQSGTIVITATGPWSFVTDP